MLPTRFKQPNETEIIMRGSHDADDGFRISLSKNDNKDIRLNRSMAGTSNRGDTHDLKPKYGVISPL